MIVQAVMFILHVPDAVYSARICVLPCNKLGRRSCISERTLEEQVPDTVTVASQTGFTRLLDMEKTPSLNDANFPEGWVNFYRVDDYSSVSYFYLDKPTSNLPALPSLPQRTANLKNQ
jgi:hypothetical protein